MLTSLASWSRNQGQEQAGNSPRNFQKHVQLLVQLNISAGCGPTCEVNEVIICSFVENHGNQMLLSLQIRAMLTWTEMPCVENLQIAYCVNCRNNNISGYCCQWSVYCDCYCNMELFLFSVERIKSFVNVHLHCIVSNVPSECANTQDHQNCCAVK